MIKLTLKSFFTLLVTLSIFNLAAGQHSTKIVGELNNAITEKPNEFHLAILHLTDREDVVLLKESSRSKGLSNEDRARFVTNTLYNKSINTQDDILEFLDNLPADLIDKESIRSFWITNAITVLAKKEAIYLLSQRSDIDKIYGEIEGEATVEPVVTFSNEERSAVTNGLKAINAPEMWKLGYTGYGTKVFVMDSGVEYTHPALRQQYLGNIKPHNESWTGDNNEPFDIGGHGTHVTGTILGLDRKNQDTIGVAFNSHWIGGPVQFSNSPRQPHRVLSFIENMQFALNPDGDINTSDDIPDAFNNSWGQTTFNESFCDPTAFFSQVHLALEAAGVAMVWSSGNSGSGASSITGYKNSNFDLVSSFAVGNVGQVAPYTIEASSSRGPSRCGGEGSLAIKPEVSAPGAAIRSSYLNGSYALLTGTSMAAPHVSGAILLLKEAFPYLVGEDILLALYFSAKDLGPEGEDNDYGMGLIDVYAAYLYLIEQGHTPVPPVESKLDLILTNISIQAQNVCMGHYPFSVDIINGGTDTIYTFNIVYSSENDPTIASTIQWEGVLVPGELKTVFVGNIELTNPGLTSLIIELTEPNGQEDQRSLNNKLFQSINVSAENQLEFDSEFIPCLGGIGTFKVNSQVSDNTLIEWFDNPNATSPIATGNEVTLNKTLANQKFYIRESYQDNVGKTIVDDSKIYEYTNETAGVIFDVESDIIIESFKSYSKNSSLSIIRIVDSRGNNVFSINQRPDKSGVTEYKIEAFIPKGRNYRLLANNSRNLSATIEDVNFPYVIDGIVSIHASFEGESDPEYDVYRNFFDWKIKIPTCNLQEFDIPVNFNDTLPILNILSSKDTVIMDVDNTLSFSYESNEEPTSFYWDFGNGQTSTEKNPTTSYLEEGTYVVSLLINGGLECSGTFTKEVFVVNELVSSTPSYLKQVSIYPNPFDQVITLKAGSKLVGESSIKMVNITGITVYQATVSLQEGAPITLSMEAIPPGVYILQLENNGHLESFKLIK